MRTFHWRSRSPVWSCSPAGKCSRTRSSGSGFAAGRSWRESASTASSSSTPKCSGCRSCYRTSPTRRSRRIRRTQPVRTWSSSGRNTRTASYSLDWFAGRQGGSGTPSGPSRLRTIPSTERGPYPRSTTGPRYSCLRSCGGTCTSSRRRSCIGTSGSGRKDLRKRNARKCLGTSPTPHSTCKSSLGRR